MENEQTSANSSKEGESMDPDSTGIKKIPGFVTADLQNYKFITEFRENLKKNPTQAEKLIWEYLRNKKTGHKIRRQHVIDTFIVDFVCLKKKVVIEIDGEIHLQHQEYDLLRTNTLNEKGYLVIRFTNAEVLASPVIVVEKIKEVLNSRVDFIKEE